MKLTEVGKQKTERYIREIEAKRKEILDAGLDTVDETIFVTIDEVEEDLSWFTENGEYCNGWGVTDNYEADYPLVLSIGEDFIEN